ncbi:hypothetical protein BCON_0468g00010 [Botryotinia convoluta]|uniref:Uncharacterized protein n=1 Tax=Botryotinia convoluta TaxID=54673 RepID=A0A4Z1H7W4_9HELO|nr:hypothetical protein BCON_0468g00010 [Botryotinia convoluta]
MAPSGKGYPPPVPRFLRSKASESLSLSQPSQQPQTQPQAQPPSRALDTLSRSSRNPSPTFPNLISRSTPRDIDPRPVSGPESQPQPHHNTSRTRIRSNSRASSRARIGSSRPPPQDISLSNPRDLVPRSRPRAVPHISPRPRLTPIDRDLILGLGPGQFQIQLQAQAQPHIDPQTQDRNQEFYTNFPSSFPTGHYHFSQSQTTIAPRDQDLHQDSHRDPHQPQLSIQVHSEARTQNQEFYTNFPSPFPDSHSPFSRYQAITASRDQDTHRELVQAPTSVQAQNETQDGTSTRASKRPRLSYSHSHPNSSREEERSGNMNRDGVRNGNEASNEIGTENGDQITTQNERYNSNDTSSESPLSTPPDSVSTSPLLPPLRNFPRTGTFSPNQIFDRSPTSRTRARAGHGTDNGTGNITSPSTPIPTPYTEPPILPSTLDIANHPTAAQRKWMYAVREEGRRNDRNENGGFSRGIEGQMVRLFGGEGEGGV